MKSIVYMVALAAFAAAGCGDSGDASKSDVAPDTASDSADTAADGADDEVGPEETAPETIDTAVAPDALEEATEEVALPCGGPCGEHASCIDDACVCDEGTIASGGDCVPSVGIASFRIEPAVAHAGQPLVAVFGATHASACRLTSELFATPLAIDAASLAAGRFELALAKEPLETALGHGAARPKVALECEGAGALAENVASASVYLELALGPGIEASASETAFPAEGGLVDICWSSPGAAFCAVLGPAEAREELAEAGCVEDLQVVPGQVNDFTVFCGDAVGNSATQNVRVIAGSGIRRFEVNPGILGAAGMAHVVWDAAGVDGCVVSRAGESIGTGASGVLDLAVATQTELVLTCTVGEQVLSETRTISVGAAILSLGFDPRLPEYLRCSTIADTCSLAITNGAFSVTMDGVECEGKEPLLLPIPTQTRIDGVAITLTCEAAGYVATSTLQIGGQPRIAAVTFDPPSVPEGGATMEMCWNAVRATGCGIYLDGSGDDAGLYGATDCAQLEVPASGMYVRLECYDEAGEVAVWEANVPSGPSANLTAEPSVLSSAGRTTLTWTTSMLGGCVVLKDGAFLAEVDAAGSLAVDVADDTSFVLRCSHDGAVFDHVAKVAVGAGIGSFDVEPTLTGAGVAWTTELVDACTLTLENGDETLLIEGMPSQQAAGTLGPTSPKPPKGGTVRGFGVPFDRALPATLTLRCAGPHGDYEEVVVVAAAVPVEILGLTVTPEELPRGGSVVDVCITSVGADRCTIVFMSLETGMGYLVAQPVQAIGFTRGNGCMSTSGMDEMFFDENVEAVVTCSGFNSSAERRVVLTSGVAVASLIADPPALAAGGTTLVSWTSVLASSCELRLDGAVVGSGASGSDVPVAIAATSDLTLTCVDDQGHSAERTLRVAVGTDLAVEAHANGAYQIVVNIAAFGFVGCVIVADNGDTYVGSGADFEREEAPLEGAYYLDWQFDNLGRANLTTTCTDPAGATVVRTLAVDPPAVPVITRFDVPTGFLAPGEADVCFAASGASYCDLYVDGLGGFNFAGGAGCWSDRGGGPAAFDSTVGVTLVCVSEQGMATSRNVVVPVGPYVLTWSVDSAVVAAGGEVVVSWSSYAMATCELYRNDVLVADGEAGEATFTLSENADFLLSCVDGAGGTHERALEVLVGRQISRFIVTVAGDGNLAVDWRALLADGCVARATTEGGSERWLVEALPLEGGFAMPWDFATDGDAHVSLVCSSEGQDDLVATTIVVPPTPLVMTRFAATPEALDAPSQVDLCWSVTGSVSSCWLQVLGRDPDPATATALYFYGGPTGCASDPESLGRPIALAHSADATLTCYGALGQIVHTLFIPVGPDIAVLSAEPPVLDAPGVSTVTWATHAVTGCELRDGAGALLASGTAGAYPAAIAASTELTLTCTTAGEVLTRHLGVGVGPSAFIEESLAIDGDLLSVAWRAERSDYCSVLVTSALGASVERFDAAPVGRQAFYYPFAERGDALIELTCYGSQTVSDSVVITSPAPRVLTFGATPAALASAGTTELCWTAVNAASCSLAFDGVVDEELANDDCLDIDVSVSADAVLTCLGDFGEVTRTLPVLVGPTIVAFGASIEHLPFGGYFTTLTWQSVLTDDCTLSDESGELATGVTGSQRLFVVADTTFTLTCAAGATTLTRTVALTAGPAITRFGGTPNATGSGILFSWRGMYASSCTLELRDVEAGRIVVSESVFRGSEVFDHELAFDFASGHTAEAALTCSDDHGHSDQETLTIGAP